MGKKDWQNIVISMLDDILQNDLNESNADNIKDYLDDFLENYDFSDKCCNYLLLLAISYMEIQCKFNPIIALKTKELKIKVIVQDISALPVVISTFSSDCFINPTATDEIFEEDENGVVIYKQYLPKDGTFVLPNKGETGVLKVRTSDKNNEECEAEVEIDDKGMVIKIIKSPKKVEKPNINGDAIYSELMSQIMEFDPAFKQSASSDEE